MQNIPSETLKLFAAHTNCGLVLTDNLGHILWVNPAFTTMTGYSLPEILGRKPSDFLHGSDTDPAAEQLITEAIRDNKSSRVDILYYHSCGQPYWARIDLCPVHNDDGHPVYFSAIHSDITQERKEIREREQQIVELYSTILQLTGNADQHPVKPADS